MKQTFEDKFHDDLKRGQVGEKVIGETAKRKGYIQPTYHNGKGFDISIFNKRKQMTTIEVKTDAYELFKRRTGNMFLEWRCNGIPSGVQATTSDWFIYYLPIDSEAWLIKSAKLKALIIDNLTNRKLKAFSPSYAAGDKGKVFGFLMNRERHRNLFKVIKIDADLNSIIIDKINAAKNGN